MRFSDTSSTQKDELDLAFDYWELASSKTRYDIGETYKVIDQDATFNAVWKHKLSFRVVNQSVADAYVGADGAQLSDLSSAMNTAAAKAKSSNNCEFAGWYDSADNDATQVFDADGNLVDSGYDGASLDIDAAGNVTMDTDVTLYAKWYCWEQVDSLQDGEQYVFASSVTTGAAKIFGAGNGTFEGFYDRHWSWGQYSYSGANYTGLSESDVYVAKNGAVAKARIIAQVPDDSIWTASSSNNGFLLKTDSKCLSYSLYKKSGWNYVADTRAGLVSNANYNSYFTVSNSILSNTSAGYINYDASGTDTVLFANNSSSAYVYAYGKALTDDPGDIVISGQYLIAAPDGNGGYKVLSAADSGDSNSEAVDYDGGSQLKITNRQIWTFDPKDEDGDKYTVSFVNDKGTVQSLDIGNAKDGNGSNIVHFGKTNGTYLKIENMGSNQFYISVYNSSNKLEGYLVYDAAKGWTSTTDKSKATLLSLIQYTGK